MLCHWQRVAIILEGRDGAGKSGTVRELTRYIHLMPIASSVIIPTKRMMKSWCANGKSYQNGQIVIYDRSWYSRALLQPVMGWCSERQYELYA